MNGVLVCVGRLLAVGVSVVAVVVVVVAPATWRLRESMTRVLEEKSRLATQWHHAKPILIHFFQKGFHAFVIGYLCFTNNHPHPKFHIDQTQFKVTRYIDRSMNYSQSDTRRYAMNYTNI